MNALKRYPKRISPLRHARNGFVPEAPFIRRSVKAQNHIMAYRRKTFLTACDFSGRFTGSAAATLYRFYGHAGHGATNLGIRIGLGLDSSGTGADPNVQIKVTQSGLPGGSDEVFIHGGNYDMAAGAPTDAPSEIVWREATLLLMPDTVFSVQIAANDYARILSLCIYEIASPVVDGAVNYYFSAEPVVEFPVYDSHRQRALQGLSQIWRHNGAHLLTWPGVGTGSPRTRTGDTTWENVIDTTTAVTSTTAGFKFDDVMMAAMLRVSDASLLNVVLAAYCSVTGSATGEVRLEDSSGTICSITGMGTAAAWYTSATTIADVSNLSKVDLQFRTSNAANTISLHAVCLYAYLA